jgi:capsular exopolysaccharide synthesis family protein
MEKDILEESFGADAGSDDLSPIVEKFVFQLKRNKLLIFFYMVAVIAVGTAWLVMQTPLYRATTVILFDPTQIQDYAMRNSFKNLAMHAAVLKQPSLLEGVMEQLDLKNHPHFRGAQSPVAAFSKLIEPELDRTAMTIDLHADFPESDMASRIANAVAQAFITGSETRGEERGQVSLDVLRKNYGDTSLQLAKVKEKIATFKKEHPEVDKEEVLQEQALLLHKEISKIAPAKIGFQTKLSEIERLMDLKEDLYNYSFIRSDPQVKHNLDQLRIAELHLLQLEQELREHHPDLISAQLKGKAIKLALKNEELRLLDELEVQLQSLEQAEKSLRDELELIQTGLQTLSPFKLDMKALEDQEASLLTTLDLLQKKTATTAIEEGIRRAGINILSYAQPPSSPHKPKKMKLMVVIIGFGLFSSLGFIFSSVYFERSFKWIEDVEMYIREPLFGVVPDVPTFGGGFQVSSAGKRVGYFKTSMDFIRSNVSFMITKPTQKVLLVTSAVPSEGKSFITYHLADSFGRAERKVVLVNMDFYRGGADHHFPKNEKSSSLKAYFVDDAPIASIIEKTELPGVDYIRSAQIQFSVDNIYHSEKMKSLLEHLKKNYDFVLIDAPPVFQDAIQLSHLADVRLLVVRWGVTRREEVRRALGKISPRTLLMTGVVLNRAKYQKRLYVDLSPKTGPSA